MNIDRRELSVKEQLYGIPLLLPGQAAPLSRQCLAVCLSILHCLQAMQAESAECVSVPMKPLSKSICMASPV